MPCGAHYKRKVSWSYMRLSFVHSTISRRDGNTSCNSWAPVCHSTTIKFLLNKKSTPTLQSPSLENELGDEPRPQISLRVPTKMKSPMLLSIALTLLVLSFNTTCHGALQRGFYNGKCGQSDVEAIIRGSVTAPFRRDPAIVAALRRMQFHDCFVHVHVHHIYLFCYI